MNPTNEQLEVIYQVAKNLSSKKWIPGYEKEDIEQEAIIIGIKGCDLYNGSIPFNKFISNHIKNRLITLRRDKYIKPGCSCGNCKKCKKNQHIININSPSDITEIKDSSIAYDPHDELISKDLIEYIDDCIPAEYRDDYIKLLQGAYIPTYRRNIIKDFIKEALSG